MSNRAKSERLRRGGRRPGPSGTREAILAAASRHFAEHGYDRASLRGIAAEAGVDQKLIAHFFGSKQQLFVAAVGMPFNPGEMLPAILAGDPDTVGERLAALLVDVLEQPELHRRLTGVVRAAASEPEVARMLREFLARELFGPAAELLGTEDGPFRANLVGTQIVGLVMARYVVAIEPLATMPPKAVAAAVAPTLQRYLLGPLATDDR
ncbi:MAG TPA: TetR family transcriptional regulator [Gaiellaceae bacterium]|nr:TetR family transcriptional regulator [Gaiellaceae bacterium]